jgi:hypothetical protein
MMPARAKDVPKQVRENFKKIGWKVVQKYNRSDVKAHCHALFQCDNCGTAQGLREIPGLGICCLTCYSNRQQCASKKCRKRTVLIKHGGLCRDCMMGPDEYREAALEGTRESSMARCEEHGIKGDYCSEKMSRKLRKKMKEIGMKTHGFTK